MADSGKLKSLNTGVVRAAVRAAGPTTKNQVARQTGLSFPTVSRTVDELVAGGELVECGVDKTTGGRSAQLYSFNPVYRLTLSIRLESGVLKWFVGGFDGKKLEEGTMAAEGRALQTLEELLAQVKGKYDTLGAVALGLDGSVNGGRVIEAFGHEELQGVDVCRHLSGLSGLPVAVENDMSVVAFGYVSALAEKSRAVVCIYLGPICAGAGVALDGQVWHGATGFAGELYYLPGEKPDKNTPCHYETMDMTAYYARLVRSYAVVLNPERIVLYQNPYIEGKTDEIRKLCAQSLPTPGMPVIESSAHFDRDYERGLSAMAEELIEGAFLAEA